MVTRALNLQQPVPDALIVGNASETANATVQLKLIPSGSREEELVGDPIILAPGAHEVLFLNEPLDTMFTSMFRTGGIHRVVSDLPIVAYVQSPYETNTTNDGSMLLPDTALGQDYVAIAWAPVDAMHVDVGTGEPSYFRVIALHDGTTVEWTPPTPSAGPGLPIPFIIAGETGTITMNRFDTMRIAASSMGVAIPDRDISGTVIKASKPIWVLGGVKCGFVETDVTCDHMQEVLFPLAHWGKRYVGVASPVRGTERHYWRVFAGADNVTIMTNPPQPGTPIQLAKRGDWAGFDVGTGVNFMFEGDKAFMAVQYLASHDNANEKGDPAMYQMVPVEQFLRRYVFVTGVDYPENYVQVIHEQGNAPVFVDGQTVGAYQSVGSFEVATVAVGEGSHLADSADPFGIVQIGYSDGALEMSNWSSYAFPGGMKVEEIFVP